MTELIELLFGFLGGIFGGMGMGGGTLLIPLLVIFLNFDQKLCQGINLLAFLVMAVFSLAIHVKNNYIRRNGIIFIILGGLIFSSIGAFLAGIISSGFLKKGFGLFLLILGIIEFINIIKSSKK